MPSIRSHRRSFSQHTLPAAPAGPAGRQIESLEARRLLAATLQVEVEDFTGSAGGSGAASEHGWEQFGHHDASNSEAMRALPNQSVNVGDTTAGPRLDYTLSFGEAGTYFVWVRMRGPAGGDDSLHLGLDGDPIIFGGQGVTVDPELRGRWLWTNDGPGGRLAVTVDSAEEHTLNLWMREDGVEVDKFVLTSDAAFDANRTGVFAESDGRVDFEAEEFTGELGGAGPARERTWAEFGSSTSSGGAALTAYNGFGTNVGDTLLGPRRDYAIDFTSAGTYYVWVRMGALGDDSDSLHLGLDGEPVTFGGQGVSLEADERTFGSVWKNQGPTGRVTVQVAEAGVHTLNLWMREDGVRVDRFVLHQDAEYDPNIAFYETSDEELLLEVEQFTGGVSGLGVGWEHFRDADAGRATAMITVPNRGTNLGDAITGPRLDYSIDFQTAGTRYAWLRMSAFEGVDDSIHVGFNDGPISFGNQGVQLSAAERNGQWTWKGNSTTGARLSFAVPEAGPHVFNIWMREDGARIDQLILTSDPDFVPA